jgi:hypothetical protein
VRRKRRIDGPRREPAAYRGSPHVTVAMIGRMAHLHNFASSRQDLSGLVDDWLAVVDRHTRRVILADGR